MTSRIKKGCSFLCKPITIPYNYITHWTKHPTNFLEKILNAFIIPPLVGCSKASNKIWAPFKYLKKPIAERIHLKTFNKPLIIVFLFFAVVCHIIALITFFGMSFVWRNEDQ